MWNDKQVAHRKDLYCSDKYEINIYWDVRNKATWRILKKSIAPNWYYVVNIDRIPRYIHRLLAIAFIPNPDNLPEVNHIDWDKQNCCLENLERVSTRDNNLHARRTWLHKSDWDKAVIATDSSWDDIYSFKSASAASRFLHISRAAICHVCNKKKKYITAWWFKRRWA